MKFKILLISIAIMPLIASAFEIIRDSEIEETLNLIAQPIVKAAKLKKLKIHLINDNELNAFTAGGNELYIYSGIINQFSDIDVIRGVIAHEVGHIVGAHLLRQGENIDLYNKVAASSVAIGLASVVAGQAALGTALAFGGEHFAQRSILSYSRAFESSADQAALKLLESSGNSAIGMIKFFEFLQKQHSVAMINRYDQTHPLSIQRLQLLRQFHAKSKYKHATNSKELEYKFARSAAKLLAFTTSKQQLRSILTQNYSQEIADYVKAIVYFRMSDVTKSIHYIDRLLILKPNDPFYYELKGQILFEFGKYESLDAYTKALLLRPNDLLIRLSTAIVGITIYEHEIEKIKPFFNDLQLIYNKEPDNLAALYYMAVYYERVGRKADALLTSAVMAYKAGDIKRAESLAKTAIKEFKQDTPSWHKANDIILNEYSDK